MPPYCPLKDAKTHFSELVKKAQMQGAQYISVRNIRAVVVISQEEHCSLTAAKISIVEFFRKSPLMGLHLDLSRDKSLN